MLDALHTAKVAELAVLAAITAAGGPGYNLGWSQPNNVWTIEKIMEYLPHRFPMLLVDRIIEFEPMKRSVGIKNVTMNDAFFQGHYPGMPIMPGVLIVEAMAQAGACMILGDDSNQGKVPLIGSIDSVKFKKPVVPGDQLRSEMELVWFRNGMGRIKGEAFVDGKVVAVCEITFKMVPRGF